MTGETGNPASGNTTKSQTNSTKKTDAPSGKVDLKGYEFVIAECQYDKYEGIKRGDSEMGDAILDRNARVEKALNCKITYDYYNALTFYEQVYSAIMAGDAVADIMTPALFNFGKLVNSDSLYDISSLPGIDLSADCWYDYFTEAATTSKGLLGVSAFLSNPLNGAYGMYYNKDLAKELGLGDLYQMVRDGTWTWDAFEDMMAKAVKDVNGDGTFGDEDRWACTGSGFDAVTAFYLSSGQKVMINEGGKVKYNLANKTAYDALNKMNVMFVNLPGAFYNPSQDFEKMQQNFWNGNVLFFIFPITPGDKFRNMEDEYGLLPLPKGPGQSKYVTPFDHNSTLITVPATVKNKEATGAILQMLAEESKKEESVWFSELENLRYRDAESLEMVQKYIIPNARADISTMYHSVTAELALAVDSAICNTIMRDRNFDATTFIEGIKDVAQSQIDDICNK